MNGSRVYVAAMAVMSIGIVTSPPDAQAAEELRPNIVFVLADDLRTGVLGCEGNDLIETPNIDALAQGGVRFSQAFVTTSICSVSRASILSGQYARRHGITDFSSKFSGEQWRQTYPAQLRAAGYYTGFIGKFGVGDAKAVVAMADVFDFWRGKSGQGGPFIDAKDPTWTHATAKFGNDAVEFIETAPTDKPICLSLSFTAPHARDGKPREYEPDLRDEQMLSGTTVPVSMKTDPKYFEALPNEAKISEGRERWKPRFSTPEKFQQTVKDYMRLVVGIDREVGRIQQALRKRGMEKNTVIIFTSDNGFFYGERGLADKWLMYEESIRVPMIVYDPRLDERQKSRVVDAFALNIDMAPTMLEMAGIDRPEVMQGRSLMPLLQGKKLTDWRTDFFYEHHFGEKRKPPIPATEGVREERWKYTRWTSTSPVFEELFDLKNDSEELRNLATDGEHEDQLERLRARRKQLREELK